MIRASLLLITSLLLSACAAPKASEDPQNILRQDDGTVVWRKEYAFTPPGGDWQLVKLDEDDFSFAFAMRGDGGFPCLSTMAYAEEPFGFSRDLEKRQKEFFKRYLWASRVVFGLPVLEEKVLNEKEVLVATIEGQEPVRRHKVRSKVVFMHRGERVVAFYFSQWRPEHVSFDNNVDQDLERFIESFHYLKPSFFETL